MTSKKLTLNHDKTKFMVITKRGCCAAMNIYINNHQIEQVKSIDYLGITIDSKLEWDVQLKKLETSLSTACGIMSKLHFVTFDCLKKLLLRQSVFNSTVHRSFLGREQSY